MLPTTRDEAVVLAARIKINYYRTDSKSSDYYISSTKSYKRSNRPSGTSS